MKDYGAAEDQYYELVKLKYTNSKRMGWNTGTTYN
jgi:hypothetical protein